mmetsp:Transcript_2889/g.11719  ORF Transcript_2889/g.11719 Transcript_2889/m.11719 type:complete len:208 (+) Transcript_2889:934-1557(+)
MSSRSSRLAPPAAVPLEVGAWRVPIAPELPAAMTSPSSSSSMTARRAANAAGSITGMRVRVSFRRPPRSAMDVAAAGSVPSKKPYSTLRCWSSTAMEALYCCTSSLIRGVTVGSCENRRVSFARAVSVRLFVVSLALCMTRISWRPSTTSDAVTAGYTLSSFCARLAGQLWSKRSPYSPMHHTAQWTRPSCCESFFIMLKSLWTVWE